MAGVVSVERRKLRRGEAWEPPPEKREACCALGRQAVCAASSEIFERLWGGS